MRSNPPAARASLREVADLMDMVTHRHVLADFAYQRRPHRARVECGYQCRRQQLHSLGGFSLGIVVAISSDHDDGNVRSRSFRFG